VLKGGETLWRATSRLSQTEAEAVAGAAWGPEHLRSDWAGIEVELDDIPEANFWLIEPDDAPWYFSDALA